MARKHKTPTEVKAALFKNKCERDGFKNMDPVFRGAIADALDWVLGEPGTLTGIAMGEGQPKVDGQSDK